LAVHYQPVISLDSGAALGAEALVRWLGDADARHAPDDFIAVAETSGLIRPLTTWVLTTAIRDAARWGALGMDLSVAVNMSGVVLQDHDLRGRIERLLRANALPASSLALEITESVILHERARDALGRMVVSGVTFAVDDFGTGYSSLAYLKRLPVQCLKIDRAFVTGMDRDPRDAAIVRSIIDLAHTLDLHVIAEGVETERVSQLLAGMGCDAAQGFHYARPMPAAQLECWLRERDASHPARRRART
jgi:EAL domain-containing protein (putative c-di-GMP-specific phosphodiesterase class I)